jgi:Methyltransferase domain
VREHFYQALPGWFDFADLYADVIASAPDRAHLVEVGTFCGKSAAFWGVEAANSGKRITIDTIDNWAGIEPEHIADPDGFAALAARMADAGGQEAFVRLQLQPVTDVVTVRTGDGVGAAAWYPDASLHAVYLDDCHETPHVARELEAWWPKVAPGGVLAGHDIDWLSVKTAVGAWGVKRGLVVRQVGARSWRVDKPALTTDDWAVPPGQRKCLVAVCCNERNVYRQTARSLASLGWGRRVLEAAETHGFSDVSLGWFDDQVLVSDLRDTAALAALQTDCSHVLYLDGDMTWPSDVLVRMLAHHSRGIVAALYHLKQWPHWPVALRDGTWNAHDRQIDYVYDMAAPGCPTLRQEELVGMGCTLVPTKLFRQLERPWFVYATRQSDGLTTITEDVPFCQKARATGCPIWLDPTIVCGHIAQPLVTTPWFERATFEIQMLGRVLDAKQQAPATASEGAHGMV